MSFAFQFSVLRGISQITDFLYLSAGEPATNPTNLRVKGINCVINATLYTQIPSTAVRLPQIEYIRVPIDDTPYSLLSSYFDSVADKIKEIKARGGRILVHCMAGVSRSASLCMVYLMKHERMTLKEAHDFIKARRPIIRPNWGFWKQLVAYEKKLYGANSVKMISANYGWIPDIYEKEMKNLIW